MTKTINSHPVNLLVEKRLKYQALIAQVSYLRSSDRTDGPSRYEVEDAAAALEREAEGISEDLFYINAAVNNIG